MNSPGLPPKRGAAAPPVPHPFMARHPVACSGGLLRRMLRRSAAALTWACFICPQPEPLPPPSPASAPSLPPRTHALLTALRATQPCPLCTGAPIGPPAPPPPAPAPAPAPAAARGNRASSGGATRPRRPPSTDSPARRAPSHARPPALGWGALRPPSLGPRQASSVVMLPRARLNASRRGSPPNAPFGPPACLSALRRCPQIRPQIEQAANSPPPPLAASLGFSHQRSALSFACRRWAPVEGPSSWPGCCCCCCCFVLLCRRCPDESWFFSPNVRPHKTPHARRAPTRD
jgi:hypothetical protein